MAKKKKQESLRRRADAWARELEGAAAVNRKLDRLPPELQRFRTVFGGMLSYLGVPGAQTAFSQALAGDTQRQLRATQTGGFAPAPAIEPGAEHAVRAMQAALRPCKSFPPKMLIVNLPDSARLLDHVADRCCECGGAPVVQVVLAPPERFDLCIRCERR